MHHASAVQMSRFRALLLIAGLACGGSLACGSATSTDTSITAPSDTRCQPAVTASGSSFPPAGGTGSVAIGVSRECGWRATTTSSWIAITPPVEGQGDGSVTFRVAENADPVARQGQLTIGDRPLTIGQAAAACRYEIAPSSSGPLAASGVEVDIAVRTHSACSWTARAEVGWATVNPSQGRGDGAVRVTVQPNAGAARLVAVEVAGQVFTATQSAMAAPLPPSPAPPAPAPAPTPPPPAPVPTTPIELDGAPSQVTGSCPTITFQLRGFTVYTTEQTKFQGGRCRDVARADEVEVEGMRMSDGRVRADKVEID